MRPRRRGRVPAASCSEHADALRRPCDRAPASQSIRRHKRRGRRGSRQDLRPVRRRSDGASCWRCAACTCAGRADLRRRDGVAALGRRGVHASASRAPTSTRPTTRRWAGRSRRRSARSASTRAGRSVTLTGDGCFLMSAMEISTAAREGLPVKFFVLDDQAYHYMQVLQKPAYLRTTATILARLDYARPGQGLRRRLPGNHVDGRTSRPAFAARCASPARCSCAWRLPVRQPPVHGSRPPRASLHARADERTKGALHRSNPGVRSLQLHS